MVIDRIRRKIMVEETAVPLFVPDPVQEGKAGQSVGGGEDTQANKPVPQEADVVALPEPSKSYIPRIPLKQPQPAWRS